MENYWGRGGKKKVVIEVIIEEDQENYALRNQRTWEEV